MFCVDSCLSARRVDELQFLGVGRVALTCRIVASICSRPLPGNEPLSLELPSGAFDGEKTIEKTHSFLNASLSPELGVDG